MNDESSRWLISQGRFKEANAILRKVQKINKKSPIRDMIREDEMKEDDGDAPRKENFMKALKFKPLNLTIYNLCYQVRNLNIILPIAATEDCSRGLKSNLKIQGVVAITMAGLEIFEFFNPNRPLESGCL